MWQMRQLSNYRRKKKNQIVSKKAESTLNGIYNQDLSSNSMLIELGGVENDINEVLNTLDALSVVFNELVKGENK